MRADARMWPAMAAVLLAGGCGGTQDRQADNDAVQAQASPAAGAPVTPPSASEPGSAPLTTEQFPALSSRDCAEVAAFYVQAIASGAFDRAALVWNAPAIDAAALKRMFAPYSAPQFTLQPPSMEGAAGSLYCTVPGRLTDAGGTGTAIDGELLLRRVNDVDGATAQQLRWTIRSATLPPTAAMP